MVEAVDLHQALVWGRKAAVACRAPVEVRPFYQSKSLGYWVKMSQRFRLFGEGREPGA